ncbi:MAG: PEP-CTERM sorting domain-containing protein [Sodalinema sp.]|uniref:PEP-CTERM sorting domain-containing protein n=1 Tax=Sodalinema sp. TaxID=3080550 RepID=UPI00396F5AF0
MQLRTALTYTAPILSASLALGALAAPAAAFSMNSGEKFGTDGLLFTEDTEVTFDFGNTFGAYVSSLGIYEVDGTTTTEVKTLFSETDQADDGQDATTGWVGTSGGAGSVVANSTASYIFKANVEYALGLASRRSDGSLVNTVFSSNSLNSFGGENTQQFVFGSHGAFDGSQNNDTQTFDNPEDFISGNPLAGSLALGIDDRGNNNDRDFQDMVLSAQAKRASAGVPEPSVVFGLAAMAGGFASLRRRRDS